MTTPNVPAERERGELRDAIASALYNEFRVGKMPDYRPMWHEVEEATRAKYRAMTNVLLEPFAALLAPQETPTYDDGSITIGKPDEHGRIAVIGKPTPEQVEAFNRVAGRAAPQEAREPEAEWIADYSRLLTAYKGAVIEYYGQPSGAGFDAVEKMRAARRALDAHVLAAARPAPETREPDGWVVDAPESLPSHVAQRVVYWGPDAKRRANNRVQRMAEVFRAFAVANPVYLGAAAPAEATERSES